jgi:ribulose-bisphosphate carboxylase small chain
VNIEFTGDPHPRNTFWDMWDLSMFDIKDAAAVMLELTACRKAHAGRRYIRISGFDASPGWESVRISFLVDRPTARLSAHRREGPGRAVRYTTESYAADRTRAFSRASRTISISPIILMQN